MAAEVLSVAPSNHHSAELESGASVPRPLGRQRSATISGGIAPIPATPLPWQQPRLSSWDLLNDRNVVQEVADTTTYPYIVGRAEDIDAIIRKGDPGGLDSEKPGKKTRGSRSRSVGHYGRPGAGDIDGYISAAPELVVLSPKVSFATRLASGFRLGGSKPSSPCSPAPLPSTAAASRGMTGSHLSFADSFPTHSRNAAGFLAGLPGPVPAAGTETLPESHFPQTLNAASEDIDVLTSIGKDGPTDRQMGSLNRLLETTDEVCSSEKDLDVDTILQVGEANVPLPDTPKTGRAASADRWHRKGRGAKYRPEGHAQTVPSSPAGAAIPRAHVITASNSEKTTDIDDVLAADPNPNIMDPDILRTIVDAGDYLLLDSFDVRPSTLGDRTSPLTGLKDEEHSIPARGLAFSRSCEAINRVSTLGRMSVVSHARFEGHLWSSPSAQASTADEHLHSRIKNDALAAEDIIALVEIGQKLLPQKRSHTARSLRTRPQDIQALVMAGEDDAGSDSDTSVGFPESPRGPSSARLPTLPTAQKKLNSVVIRRVSFTEIDANAIVAEHGTSPTVAAPSAFAGSLDIDQLFAGETPGGWEEHNSVAAHAHRRAHADAISSRGFASGGDIYGGDRPSVPSKSRNRSISLGSSNLGPTVGQHGEPGPSTTATAQRRLTCLDISHFMGIADTVEADYEGLSIGGGTKRVSLGNALLAPSDIKSYLSLGDLPVTEETPMQLDNAMHGTPRLALGPGSGVHGHRRQGSSLTHLVEGHRWSQAVPGRQDDANTPLELNAVGEAALAKRFRRSLDELALANRFPKEGSLRELFAAEQRAPAMASSIVGVRPPKIDIDELLCWGAQMRMAMERKFSLRGSDTSGGGSTEASVILSTRRRSSGRSLIDPAH